MHQQQHVLDRLLREHRESHFHREQAVWSWLILAEDRKSWSSVTFPTSSASSPTLSADLHGAVERDVGDCSCFHPQKEPNFIAIAKTVKRSSAVVVGGSWAPVQWSA